MPSDEAANFGFHVKFLIQTTFTSTFSVTAAATEDLLYGGVTIVSNTPGEQNHFQPNATDDHILSADADTKGRLGGGWVEFTLLKANVWLVNGVLCGVGTLATPFI